MFVSFFDWFKFICVIYIRQKGPQAFQSAPVKTVKFVGRPVSHKALSSAALLRGRPDGVVVNTSALESRGRGFKSRSGVYIYLLKTGLGILDFLHFDWLNGARLSAHIPAATKYGQ